MRTRWTSALAAALAVLVMVDLSVAQESPSFFEKARKKITQAIGGGTRARNHNERMNTRVLEPFKDTVAEVGRSTARVYGEGGQRAMGVVVDANGFILTKYSELVGELSCKLPDGESVKAEVVGVDKERDLAMLKVGRTDLIPVIWSENQEPPNLGSWVVTAGSNATPLSIGVVSTTSRKIKAEPGFLGVGLADAEDGVAIDRVLEGGVAAKAGLKVNDVVTAVDGADISKVPDLQGIISGRRPNTTVELKILRGGESMLKNVLLGRRSDAKIMAHEQRLRFQEQLGGKISERRDSFPLVFQHDSVIAPKDCGGALVDLDGRVIGLNIARASRIGSYALPVAEILPTLEPLKAGKGKELIEERERLIKESTSTRRSLVGLVKSWETAKRAHENSLKEVSNVRIAVKKASDDTELQKKLEAAVSEAESKKNAMQEAEKEVRDAQENLRNLKAKLISIRN